MKLQAWYLALICLFSVIDCFEWKSFHEYPANAGVAQGSILDLTLLLLYINVHYDDVICKIIISADDTTLYSCSVKIDCSVLEEKYILGCLDSFSHLNLNGTLTLPLLLKLPPTGFRQDLENLEKWSIFRKVMETSKNSGTKLKFL